MKRIFIAIIFLIIICSCSSNDETNRLMKKMYGSYVNISLDSMKCWCPRNDNYTCMDCDSKLTLVSYFDTSDCSLCYLQHLELWNDFVKMEKDYRGIIRFLFIIESRNGEGDLLYEQLGLTNLKHCIYIDVNKTFYRNNLQIPPNRLFHTFLLDQNNRVVLVGDPLRNENIEQLFLQIIESNK